MPKRNAHPVLALALLAAVLALLFAGIHKYRYRFIDRNADLVRWLPQNQGASTFFLDVSLLRQSGYLNLLAGANTPADADYSKFVAESNFDYAKDGDAVAGSIFGERLTLLARGRFDWTRLTRYARAHGGACEHDECHVLGSQPDRIISFAELQPDVLVVTIGPKQESRLVQNLRNTETVVPVAPLWIRPFPALLHFPNQLPFALRSVAIALQSATSLLVSLNTSTNAAAFDIILNAGFENGAAADTAKTQLAQGTQLLKGELQREHTKPNAADLTGLLTAGTFSVHQTTLTAVWPVPKELLNTLR